MDININAQSIILIILGIIAIIFPMTAIATIDVFISISLVFVALVLFSISIPQFSINKLGAVLYMILGILALLAAYFIMFNPAIIAAFTSVSIYFFGFLLILSGILTIIFNRAGGIGFAFGISNIIFGILYLIISRFLYNPVNLGLVIGIWLLFSGVLALFND